MKFRYSATDNTGAKRNGNIEAVDRRSAAVALRDMQLVPISIVEEGRGIDLSNLSLGAKRVTPGEMTNFTRQLATMITAGLPLTDALSLLKLQSPPALRPIVTSLLADVQAGLPLSEAMGKYPGGFSNIYVALIKAGEAAGVVETVLNRLADNLEKTREFNSKVKGAMIYPIIVLAGMVGIMVLMMIAVIPKLTGFYAQSNIPLPFATRLVIGVSNFFVNFWWLMAVISVIGVWLGVRVLNTSEGRKRFDSWVYKVPIAGPLLREVMLTELTRTLSMLLGAGVAVVDSLNIVSGAVGNVIVQAQVQQIAKQVEKGFPVSISFTDSSAFPPIVGQMLAVGEETGKMDDVLQKLSIYFGSEAEEKTKGLTTAIEPIIIIILALGVGFLMYAVIMPLYGITNQI